jgi:hypothetical protein
MQKVTFTQWWVVWFLSELFLLSIGFGISTVVEGWVSSGQPAVSHATGAPAPIESPRKSGHA